MPKALKEIMTELTALNRQLSNVVVFGTHFENEGHVVECWTKSGTFTLGYNLKGRETVNLLRSLNCLMAALQTTDEANGIFNERISK